MLTNTQEIELFDKGFVELPQLVYDGPKDIFKTISKELNKTYNSDVDFHNQYLKKKNITTKLRDNLVELSKNKFGITAKKNDIYTICRIVQSYDNLESYRGHFDSHLFTLVTPVLIPKANDPESGQLILFPKIRKEPTNELGNFLGKLKFNLLHANKKGFKNLMQNKNYKELNFNNLNPVLFLGRQSFHGNRSFAKAPDGIRVTLLTHFFDPSSGGIGAILRKIRNR
tara:strand:- start:6002 stop:6682 length:681 start_codon:yes stop_codon:yes gene_type:complete